MSEAVNERMNECLNERNGMEWRKREWNGAEWNGTEWNGTEYEKNGGAKE